MRILVVTPSFPHAAGPTEGLFNEAHAKALSRAGAEVTVVVCKPWLPGPLARSVRRYRHLAGLPLEDVGRHPRTLYARYLHVPGYRLTGLTVAACSRAVLERLRAVELGGFDLLQVHGAWPAGLAGPEVAERLGCPLVVTLHIEDDAQLIGSSTGRALYAQMAAGASALVAVGSPLKAFAARFASGPNVHVIPNGVDLEETARVRVSARPSATSGGRIVSVGNLWPVKGIDLNLRALARLTQRGVAWESYTVVGDGPERAPLGKLARELGIADRLRFTGRLSHEEALREIADADVFTLPSWREGFGVVYLEAMACGKPVVGCLGQGAGDIIRHELDGLLVEPRSVEGLVGALARLLSDSEVARAMGQAGQQRAKQFTWERTARRYLELYRSIARTCRDRSGARGDRGAA